MRVAIKAAYLGLDFFGSQRQPGKRTVEGELLKALEKCARTGNFQSAGRTDRGVSAIGMVFAFDCESLNLNQLNHYLPPDMCCYALAEAPDNFNPRFAKERHYRYFLPGVKSEIKKMRALAKALEGTHDFSNFCKKSERNPVRAVTKIKVSRTRIDFFAESFLWQQVRRMAYAILEAGKGGEIQRAEGSEEPQPAADALAQDPFSPGNPVPPLPPENLLLANIRYPQIRFETDMRILSKFKSRMGKLAEKKRVEELIYTSFLRCR